MKGLPSSHLETTITATKNKQKQTPPNDLLIKLVCQGAIKKKKRMDFKERLCLNLNTG